jgi:mersacidin/lichenicidin family type 2 lantibiotic
LLECEHEKGNIHMSNMAQAWKDETDRRSLSVEEQAMQSADAAGGFELTDEDLEAVSGAGGGSSQTSGFGLASVVESLLGGASGQG